MKKVPIAPSSSSKVTSAAGQQEGSSASDAVIVEVKKALRPLRT